MWFAARSLIPSQDISSPVLVLSDEMDTVVEVLRMQLTRMTSGSHLLHSLYCRVDDACRPRAATHGSISMYLRRHICAADAQDPAQVLKGPNRKRNILRPYRICVSMSRVYAPHDSVSECFSCTVVCFKVFGLERRQREREVSGWIYWPTLGI